jgi:trimethylamine--corrinoid protein Co-methyltransferase
VYETAPVRRNYENANHESVLCDTDSFEQWTEGGSLDMQQRANTRWKQMLADYDEPPIDAAIDRELCAFIDARKASVPDAWY